MATIEMSYDFKAPLETVFAFLSDPRNELKWRPDLLELALDPPTAMRVGSFIEAVHKTPFGKQRMRVECVALEPNRCMSFRGEQPFPMAMDARFEATPGGSRMLMRIEMQPPGVMKLFAPLMLRAFRRQRVQQLPRMEALLAA
jgi:uncharacterized protein YndB with AHSA1/START domain